MDETSAVPAMPRRRFKLRDGSIGTEYQAILEAIAILEGRKVELEGKLEDYRRRLVEAEGRPVP